MRLVDYIRRCVEDFKSECSYKKMPRIFVNTERRFIQIGSCIYYPDSKEESFNGFIKRETIKIDDWFIFLKLEDDNLVFDEEE